MVAVLTHNTSSRPAQVTPGTAPTPPRHLRVIDGGNGRSRVAPGIYARRRLVAFLVVLMLVATLAIAANWTASAVSGLRSGSNVDAQSASAVATPSPIAGDVYRVKPGDTLWSIARSLQPEGEIRPLVDELARRNGGAVLQAGQQISLDGLGG